MTDGHIFISYARQDGRDYAARLDAALQKAGFTTWRDTRDIDPNQDFSAELEGAISASSHVVCCVTPDTKRDNSFVRREIGYALALKKPLVPLVFENTLPPIQIINVTRIDAAVDSWERAMAELTARLRRADDRTYEQVTLPADPYRDYLAALYDQIVRYLNLTVFSLITLRGEASPDAVERATTNVLPMAFFDMAGVNTPSDDGVRFNNFQEAFHKYDGRVLLLGEPGAGKTTTLFAFARDAVAARLENPALPLPILAPIATWDAKAQTPLADWLAASVPALKSDEISQLINSGSALLLLDGLDELGGQREDEATKEKYDPRLRFMQTHFSPLYEGEGAGVRVSKLGTSLVISCRIKDYAEIGAKLPLKGAVTLQPLNDDQMRDYLRDVPDLWAALESDDDLREVAHTPLLLSLFTFAFRDLPEEAKQLRSLQRGDLRDKIFETYVKKRYEHEKRKLHADLPFTLEEIVRILSVVAEENVLKNVVAGSGNNDAISLDQFQFVGHQADLFVQFMRQLHLLNSDQQGNIRFIHLLLRDYFAYSRAIATLSDGDRVLRYLASTTLGHLGDRRAVNLLIAALVDVDAVVRSGIAVALGKLGDARAVDALIAALADPDRMVRSSAITALGKLGDARAVDALIAALADPDKMVRYNTAVALGSLGDPRAVNPLFFTLDDPVIDVSYGAARALKQMATPEALAALEAWRERQSGEGE